MEELTWGTPLFFDLWMAGMAGGAYFAAFLFHLFGADKEKRLLKLATYIGVPLVLLGVLALVIDLGKPTWSWHLFVRFRLISSMSMGSWILFIWSIVAVFLIALWFAEIVESPERLGLFGQVAYLLRPLVPATKALTWIALVFAVLLMTYTGVVLSTTSQVLWRSTILLPALFVTSAVSTGLAVLIVAVQLMGAHEPSPTMAQLRKALTVLIIIQLVVLVGFLLWLSAAGVVWPLISGTLGLLFWIGVVVIGMLAPLGLELKAIAQGERANLASFLSALWVMIGGFILRAVMVLGGQIYG